MVQGLARNFSTRPKTSSSPVFQMQNGVASQICRYARIWKKLKRGFTLDEAEMAFQKYFFRKAI
jgi:hypothetical protein